MKISSASTFIKTRWDICLLFAILILTRVILYSIARPHWQDLVNPDTRQMFEVAYSLDNYGTFAHSRSYEPYGSLDCSLRVGPLYPVFLTAILRTGNIFLKEPLDRTAEEWPGTARLPFWDHIVEQTRKVGFTTIHYDLVMLHHIMFAFLTGLLLFYLVQRYAGNLAAKATIFFYALDPPTNTFTVYVNTETLFMLLFISCITLFFISMDKDGRKAAILVIASGFLAGLAALCRVIALYFFTVIFLVLLFYRNQHSWKWLIHRYTLWHLGFLPLILLWLLRNFLVVGTPVFETISGRNLLLYRASGIMSEVNGSSLEDNGISLYEELAERVKDKGLTPIQYAQQEKKLAFEVIRKHPFAAIKTTALSFIRLMLSPGRSEMGQVLGYYPSMLIQHNEVIHFYKHLNFSNLKNAFTDIKKSLIWVLLLSWSYLAILYTCSLAGIYSFWKKNPRITLALGVIFLYFAGLSSGPESVSRFRVPFVPVLCIFAGIGITTIITLIKKNQADKTAVKE